MGGAAVKLRCTQGPRRGETFDIDEGEVFILGREPEPSTEHQMIQLPSRTVSRQHAWLELQNHQLLIRDLHSSNGIRVNRHKTQEQVLSKGDTIQIGEFTFVVDDAELSQPTVTHGAVENTAAKAVNSLLKRSSGVRYFFQKYWARFEELDLKWRIYICLGFFGLLIHAWISVPLSSDARKALLQQSYEIGRRTVRSLADRNRREMADASFYLLDCEFVKSTKGVLESVIYDARGKVVCPVGTSPGTYSLVETGLSRSEALDNCEKLITEEGGSDCDLVAPIREWNDQLSTYATVGLARVRYEPSDALEAMQNLRAISWKTLLFACAFLALAGWLIQRWITRGVLIASDWVHTAASSAQHGLEKIESFAALDPLMAELNRLISKRNQGVKAETGADSSEASFLQTLLQQVLLLEERAVMVVDRDNHLLAASDALSAVVPVDVSQLNRHIAEAITDSHLQGEIVGFLNDLSETNEVLDRPLSLADRVIHARGMPLFLNEQYVAALLIF